MTREEFVEEGLLKGFVDNPFKGLPGENKLMAEVLLDPIVTVIVVEGSGTIPTTAHWRDPDAVKVKDIQDSRVSLPIS